MKKGYSSVSPYSIPRGDNKELYSSGDFSDKSPLVIDRHRKPFWSFLSPKQLTRKAFMLRSRTRGIKLLGGLLLISLLAYIYFSSTIMHIDQFVENELSISELFKSIPSNDHIKTYFNYYASHPHLASSEQDHTLAIWTRNQWINYGITDTKLETFHPVLNYPKSRRLAIVQGPKSLLYEAALDEEDNQVPAFHAYSGNGNVTGPVVYVNYGRISDFQALQVRGVLFKGTIALIRNGVIPRGMKVKMAEKFGCIGALLFSDPDDDGSSFSDDETNEEIYPNGPRRSAAYVERGSVQYVSEGVGDPTTPGYASTHTNVTRVKLSQSKAVPGIPSLPISGKDALPLLKATEGFGVPSDIAWLGGLCNVSYYSGPSEALVNLVNINTYETKPIWNVIGKIKGSEEPHRSIIVGNHRDAWGHGAVDPSSGSAVLMELARTLGVLIGTGWRPKRTIILASWDAEEYGAIGSTEWVEKHASWLQKEAIAYLNVDYAVSGKHFTAQASPLINRLLYQVTDEVIDPESSQTVLTRWKFERGLSEDISILEDEAPLVDPLDVESDHVGFFHHAGIASASIGFRGSFGVQHSALDTAHWMENYGDPTFSYHRTLTQIWGLVALRLSSDTIVPLYPQDYVPEIVRYVRHLGSSQGCMSFPFISSQLDALEKASARFDKKMKKLTCHLTTAKNHKKKKTKKHIRHINERVTRFELALTDQEGAITERPWFTHMVYGPDKYSGKVRPLPSLVEAIESGDPVFLQWTEKRMGHIFSRAENTLKGDFEEDDDDLIDATSC